MIFKNRFEEWLDKNRAFNGYKKDCKEVWDAAEKPLLEIIEAVIEEEKRHFFNSSYHLLSQNLRDKIAELLE